MLRSLLGGVCFRKRLRARITNEAELIAVAVAVILPPSECNGGNIISQNSIKGDRGSSFQSGQYSSTINEKKNAFREYIMDNKYSTVVDVEDKEFKNLKVISLF